MAALLGLANLRAGSVAKDEAQKQVGGLMDLAFNGEYLTGDRFVFLKKIHELSAAQLSATASGVLESGRGPILGRVLNDICFVWGQKDHGSAMAFADSIGDRSLRTTCSRTAFEGWAESDWQAARAWFERQPPSARRDQFADSLMVVAAVREPHAGLKMLHDAVVQGKDQEISTVMSICANKAPDAALQAWNNLPPGKAKDRARESLAGSWAGVEPERAWKWASMLANDKEGSDTRRRVLLAATELDPARAEPLAMQSSGKDRGSLLEAVGWAWGRKDPDAAVLWASGLPDDVKVGVFESGLRHSDLANPKAILQPALELPAGRDRDLAVSCVLHQWSSKSYAEVRDWLAAQPPGPDLRLFIISLSNPLAEQDPELLLSLFDRLPNGKEKDLARYSLRTALEDFQPEMVSRIAPPQ